MEGGFGCMRDKQQPSGAENLVARDTFCQPF
jgi:hypothetical protein